MTALWSGGYGVYSCIYLNEFHLTSFTSARTDRYLESEYSANISLPMYGLCTHSTYSQLKLGNAAD